MPADHTNPKVTIRRGDQPGDLGWVVMAHSELYAREYGWEERSFEARLARIVAELAEGHDPAREAAWIAEVDGNRVGCVLLTRTPEEDTAKLRLLLVTPQARGVGVGSRLPRQFWISPVKPATAASRCGPPVS